MSETPAFSWRFSVVAAIASALVAVTAMLIVLLALISTGNSPLASDTDATVLAVIVAIVLAPLLSCLTAFTVSVFAAKHAMLRHALVAMGLSVLFDVAFGVPAAVLAVVLTAPR